MAMKRQYYNYIEFTKYMKNVLNYFTNVVVEVFDNTIYILSNKCFLTIELNTITAITLTTLPTLYGPCPVCVCVCVFFILQTAERPICRTNYMRIFI